MEYLWKGNDECIRGLLLVGNDKHVRCCSQHQGKLSEYSSTVLFPTCSEGFCVTPVINTVITVLNVSGIVLSGELGE